MKRIGLAAVACLGVLAFAPAAHAAGDTLAIGPVKVGGYQLRATVSDVNGADFVSVTMTKRRGESVQTHSYFLERQVTVTGPDDFSSARVTGSLGSRGSLNLTFTALEGAKADPVPSDCTGDPGIVREGLVKGRFRFVVDRRRFGSVVIRQADAVYGQGARFGCVNAGFAKGLVLTADRKVGSREHFLHAEQNGGTAELLFGIIQGIERHTIEVRAPRVLLTARRDLSRGSLRSLGPFLSGRATVRDERLSGDLTAHFDWPGRIRFPRTSNASLSRETGGS